MPAINIALILAAVAAESTTAAFQFPHIIQQDRVKLELMPRSPEQIASFYEARGFPRAMIDELSKQCFITVRIHNQGDQVLWLELANWTFSSAGHHIERKHRNAWIQHWQSLNMPMHSQATFRWTLLPETLDYLPDEQESGNLILPATEGNITLQATFATGDDKQGKAVTLRYDELKCATDR